MEAVKQCTNCKQEKPVELFYRNGKSKDGKMAICKDCSNDRISQMNQNGYYNSKNTNYIREEYPDFVKQVRKEIEKNKFIQPRKRK